MTFVILSISFYKSDFECIKLPVKYEHVQKSGTDRNDGHGHGRQRSARSGERCGLNVCVVPSLNGWGLSI